MLDDRRWLQRLLGASGKSRCDAHGSLARAVRKSRLTSKGRDGPFHGSRHPEATSTMISSSASPTGSRTKAMNITSSPSRRCPRNAGRAGRPCWDVRSRLRTFLKGMPGMSAFVLEDGRVYHSYSTYGRGLDDPVGRLPVARPCSARRARQIRYAMLVEAPLSNMGLCKHRLWHYLADLLEKPEPWPSYTAIQAEKKLMTHRGQCFCGEVEVEVSGEPGAQGYCHCKSCRTMAGAPVRGFTLSPADTVRVTRGEDQLKGFNKTDFSDRRHCSNCGGQVLIHHPSIGMTDVHSETFCPASTSSPRFT